MKPLDTILFDFDGTLAPNLDLPDMRRQVIELTQQHAVPQSAYVGRYIVEVIDGAVDFLRKRNASTAESYYTAAHQLIVDIELSSAADTDPFPGVPELLTTLQKDGFKTGIVTRNCRDAVLNVFPDVLEHVGALHTRDDTVYLKPDKRHILENLACLKSTPHSAAIVGDGALDMDVGRALGMTCIGVLTGSADRAALTEAGADIVIESCLGLANLDLQSLH